MALFLGRRDRRQESATPVRIGPSSSIRQAKKGSLRLASGYSELLQHIAHGALPAVGKPFVDK